MENDGDFVPDYTYQTTNGLVCTRKSRIQLCEGNTYVSAHNRLYIWNTKTLECVGELGSRKQIITSFVVSKEKTIIGYENGVIEVVTDDSEPVIVKLHRRRVLSIVLLETGFISSSADGSICQFDFILGECTRRFTGSNVSVESIVSYGNHTFGVCADKTLRVWNESLDTPENVFVFDDYLFSIAVYGQQVLVFFRDGSSVILDMETRSKRPFQNFSKLRNVIVKDGHVGVHTKKQLLFFSIVNGTALSLRPVFSAPTDSNLFKFDFLDRQIVFLSNTNKLHTGELPLLSGSLAGQPITRPILDMKHGLAVHSTEIIQVAVDEHSVFTLSKEMFIEWRVEENNRFEEAMNAEDDTSSFSKFNLEARRWFKLNKAQCFCLFDGHVVIGGLSGILIYNNGELKREMVMDGVTSLCAFNDILAVSCETTVYFYDNEFNQVNELGLLEPITFARFSPAGNIFCVSMLDNKIGVFNYPELDLKLTLYGHSLPVRAFSFSADGRLLLSCGADRLVKLWGLEFGDCRKTFIGDARNCEFVVGHCKSGPFDNGLFLFCDKTVHYYKGHTRLRRIACFEPGLVAPGKDFIVCTAEKGIALFTMNKYEFMAGEESEEEAHPALDMVANTAAYDNFLSLIERLEAAPTELAMTEFYKFLNASEFQELSSYIQILDQASVDIILKTLNNFITLNTVLNARVFLLVFVAHPDYCKRHSLFKLIRDSLMGKIKELRDSFGCNEARMLVESKFERIDLD